MVKLQYLNNYSKQQLINLIKDLTYQIKVNQKELDYIMDKPRKMQEKGLYDGEKENE